MPGPPQAPIRNPPAFSKAAKSQSEVATLFMQGIALHQQGQLAQAKLVYELVLSKQPAHFDALHLSGVIAAQSKNLALAVELIGKAIEINSINAVAHSNLGKALQELKRLGEAIACYNRAIEIKPDYAEAYYNRGNTFQELKGFEEALASYNMAIEIKPDYAEAHFNRGIAFQGLKRVEEALASYNMAIEIKPDYAEAHSNRGHALQELKQLDAALASYEKAILLKPDYTDAYYNRGLLKLVLRDFNKGFTDCKHRWDTENFSAKPQKTTIPSPSKSGLKGRLLIWAEQGLGDEIFYAGLLPLLSIEDVSITLSADKRLHPIYTRSFPKVDLLDKDILMNSSVNAGFNAQAPIGDVGLLLDVDAAAIQATRSPYLMSDPVKRDSYRRTISAFGSGLVCGVAWKSLNPKFGTDKSISLDSFGPLLDLPGVHFINLQYGEVIEEIQKIKSTLSVDVHQVPGVDVFYDIEGLLALIDACDVIVTTSNVTAHLAGSIGKRAAVLVPHSTGKIWYWHHNDERSFWYPSLKLFYQDNPHTWNQTIEDCAAWVKGLQ